MVSVTEKQHCHFYVIFLKFKLFSYIRVAATVLNRAAIECAIWTLTLLLASRSPSQNLWILKFLFHDTYRDTWPSLLVKWMIFKLLLDIYIIVWKILGGSMTGGSRNRTWESRVLLGILWGCVCVRERHINNITNLNISNRYSSWRLIFNHTSKSCWLQKNKISKKRV